LNLEVMVFINWFAGPEHTLHVKTHRESKQLQSPRKTNIAYAMGCLV
jgi:hypothetical protein